MSKEQAPGSPGLDGPDAVRQAMAIHYSKVFGEHFASQYPEIADLYRIGLTHEAIVDRLGLAELTATRNVARVAVCEALKILMDEEERKKICEAREVAHGQAMLEAGMGIHGLTAEQRSANGSAGAAVLKESGKGIFGLTVDELRATGRKLVELGLGIHGLDEEALAEIRRQGGQKTAELGVGVHGMTDEQRHLAGKKGGAASRDQGKGVHALTHEQLVALGRKAYEEGLGVHGQTQEERREVGLQTMRDGVGIHGRTPEEISHAGKLRALKALGRLPWHWEAKDLETGLDEGDYLWMLANDPHYQFPKGHSQVGKPNSAKITQKLNDVFHDEKEVRNAAGVRNYIYRRRKKENG
jgi:general stress protein YciG